MPGVSRYCIRESVELADRVGVNLEAPTPDAFDDLCSSKGDYRVDIVKRLEWIAEEVLRARRRAKDIGGVGFGFGRSGVDTQMIVGAVGETDWQHLKATTWLYRSLNLRRVYYSGFEPIEPTPLEDRPPCPAYREYRLYQSSFLMRDYGFSLRDFGRIVDDKGFLLNSSRFDFDDARRFDSRIEFVGHKRIVNISLSEVNAFLELKTSDQNKVFQVLYTLHIVLSLLQLNNNLLHVHYNTHHHTTLYFYILQFHIPLEYYHQY